MKAHWCVLHRRTLFWRGLSAFLTLQTTGPQNPMGRSPRSKDIYCSYLILIGKNSPFSKYVSPHEWLSWEVTRLVMSVQFTWGSHGLVPEQSWVVFFTLVLPQFSFVGFLSRNRQPRSSFSVAKWNTHHFSVHKCIRIELESVKVHFIFICYSQQGGAQDSPIWKWGTFLILCLMRFFYSRVKFLGDIRSSVAIPDASDSVLGITARSQKLKDNFRGREERFQANSKLIFYLGKTKVCKYIPLAPCS